MELNEWRGTRGLPKLDVDQIKQQYFSAIASQGENASTQQATPTLIQGNYKFVIARSTPMNQVSFLRVWV